MIVQLLFALCVAGAEGCITEADCAFAGDCIDGACQCDVTWQGDNCTELALLPATTDDAAGLRRANSSSWGGSVIRDKASGKYYMFFSDMSLHCGLNSWQRNSQIAIATSQHPTGPFAVEESLGPVAKAFAHNPTVHGPTPDGYYVIFHIGSGKPSAHGMPQLDCKNGTTPPKLSDRSQATPPPPLPPSVPNILVSKELAGPWSSAPLRIIAHPEAGGSSSCNNPAATFHQNGTVLLVCKVSVTPPDKWRQMAVYTAPSWRGPYTFRRLTPVFGEDPYVWHNPQRDAYHMIFHSMHPHKLPSTAFSKNGLDWTPDGFAGEPSPTPRAAFNSSIALANGKVFQAHRRERHQLLFDETTREPIALFNGVSTGEADYVFTAAQPIRCCRGH